ncbi:MAG: hypothetical protein U9N48_02100 [Euryarchaeota archaeon]|nr:hypothetical protein [Euryarchaeota archaeon]
MAERREFFFLREKPAQALLAVRDLDPAYASRVAKKIESTFPHTTKILTQLDEMGLIRSRLEGRIRYLELTDHGERVASALADLIEVLASSGRLWGRMERLREAIDGVKVTGPEAALCLGPLRRDAARLKDEEDEDLRRAAEELDRTILAMMAR